MFEQNQNLSSNQAPVIVAPSVAPVTENTISVEQVASYQPKRKWWLYVLLVLIFVLLSFGGWWYYAKGQVILLAKNMTWKSGENYKMSQILNVNLSDIMEDNNLGGFKNISIKLNGVTDVVNDKLDGQINFVLSGDDKEIKFSLKSKKIDKTVYLSIDSQDNWAKMFPFDLTTTWISVDQKSLQANPLWKGRPLDYMPFFKDWSQKNNAFLQNIKDKKLIILSDPHQTKEVAGVKLKKMDFNINPDKINEFLLASIDAFAEPSMVIEMKKSFETYKTKKQGHWVNMQDFIKATTFSFWVDTKSKNIQGIDFTLNNFDLIDENEHLFNVTVNFSQILENIESKEIVIPENVVTLDELQSRLFPSFSSDIKIDPITACEGVASTECAQMQTADFDNDGLNNADEFKYNTDPNDSDSDNDGYLDGGEVKNGYNPLGSGKL